MLISNRIAVDPTFLRFHPDFPKDEKILHHLREKIMGSVKVIVGDEFLTFRKPETDAAANTFSDGTEIFKEVDGKHTVSELIQHLSPKIAQFEKYSKLPFDSVFFESSTMGVLVQKKDNGKWLLLTDINGENGLTLGLHYVILFDTPGVIGNIKTDTTLMSQNHKLTFDNLFESHQGFAYEVLMMRTIICYKILDILLHFNISNVRVHKYTLSNKESKFIPGKFKEKYVYRILDVFREKTVYHSLKEIETHISDTTRATQRKAHLVRGHFKERSNKLFWWNPFVRCRKNAESEGIVKKDYQLH